jgi:hypothetical protein
MPLHSPLLRLPPPLLAGRSPFFFSCIGDSRPAGLEAQIWFGLLFLITRFLSLVLNVSEFPVFIHLLSCSLCTHLCTHLHHTFYVSVHPMPQRCKYCLAPPTLNFPVNPGGDCMALRICFRIRNINIATSFPPPHLKIDRPFTPTTASRIKASNKISAMTRLKGRLGLLVVFVATLPDYRWASNQYHNLRHKPGTRYV